jgi:hypothetical protein
MGGGWGKSLPSAATPRLRTNGRTLAAHRSQAAEHLAHVCWCASSEVPGCFCRHRRSGKVDGRGRDAFTVARWRAAGSGVGAGLRGGDLGPLLFLFHRGTSTVSLTLALCVCASRRFGVQCCSRMNDHFASPFSGSPPNRRGSAPIGAGTSKTMSTLQTSRWKTLPREIRQGDFNRREMLVSCPELINTGTVT